MSLTRGPKCQRCTRKAVAWFDCFLTIELLCELHGSGYEVVKGVVLDESE